MKKKQSKPNQSEQNRSREWDKPTKPILRFSPTAWAKLLCFRDRGNTEISGFGISDPDDLLYVIDFVTIKQDASVVTISLDDEAVANFFEDQVDAGRKPEQFFRIWAHTHPGESPTPSGTDESTFQRVFGKCDWAVMFVIAQEGKTYARLRFNVGPGGQVMIPVEVDYSRPFDRSDQENWGAEYQKNIRAVSWTHGLEKDKEVVTKYDLENYARPSDVLEQIEEMEPEERQYVLEELAARPDLWMEESERCIF